MSKKAFVCVFCALGAALLAGGCASADKPLGVIFTDSSFNEQATGAELSQLKLGISVAESYFGLVGIGDCSIDTAAKNAGITEIKYVDKACYTIFGYTKITTKVYGSSPERGKDEDKKTK